MQKKKLAAILALSLTLCTVLSGYAFQDGIGNVYYESNREIARQTYIKEQIAGHIQNGIEHAYMVNSDEIDGFIQPYVFSGEINGKYTLTNMIDWIEKSGYRVVAGINGDLFDTATGTPKGLTIHNGKIKSSGYAPDRVLAFDASGAASLATVNLAYNLKAMTPNGEVPMQINYFNVPHGGAKGLHLFNRQYAPNTKTTGNCVEVVLDAGSVENAEPIIGKTITATVVSVTSNTCNTVISDNQLVLSTVSDSATAPILATLTPGSTVDISVTDNDGSLTDKKEVIGVYHVIAENGVVTATSNSLNPRTAVGIKSDGSIIIYGVDGRQPSVSAGLGLVDLAKHLIAQGCTTVLNMDGGGSTSFAVRYPGIKDKASVINSPSEGSLRKLSNGLFLVYKGQGDGVAENLHVYSAMTLAMPGADVQLKTYASDSYYEPANLPGSVSYEVTKGEGKINDAGLYTAGMQTGSEEVTARSGNLSAVAKVQVVNDIIFTPSVTSLMIDPKGTKDINVIAKFGFAPVKSKDSLFKWSCDKNIGTIDENGLFTATEQPAVGGYIYISYGEKTKSIPVQVGGTKITFEDIQSHWAKDFIETLAGKGIVRGMDQTTFLPDAQLTRAQFLTMLAAASKEDVQNAPVSGFTDVLNTEWYYSYVNWGVSKGIVKGMDATTFAPNANITREQMAIMLKNYATLTNITLSGEGNTTFTDNALISPWALESVQAIAAGSIMSGRPEGNFDPQGLATRAEAATVLCKMPTQ
ncbi:MAG: S-layer homology domain-containing protein [Anaerovorax sp.]|nr:S-layer homology domain-containing protein [Anaerovorax sp.]